MSVSSAPMVDATVSSPFADDHYDVNDMVRQNLARCSYRFCFNQVTWEYRLGRLVLRGRVPSFYLKQVLQTQLRDIPGVTELLNKVEVVSASGLSS